MKHTLRYREHDIELPDGKFVIGRAAVCQLSLDDPLVSRQHAALVVEGDAVFIEDLGSRNGLRVNDAPVGGRYRMNSGDVLLIGSQELRYQAQPQNPGDTLVQSAGPRQTGFGLLGLLADKALALGKGEEAERLIAEPLEQLLGGIELGRGVTAEQFERASRYAMRLATATHNARWVEYIFRLYGAVRRPCPADIVDELYQLLRRVERLNIGALRTYIDVLRESTGTLGPAERFLVSRIEGLERLVAAR